MTMLNSTTVAFFTMGVLNNIPYVIMLAGAKDISEGGTALVFIANTMPGLVCKLSVPYWFDKVSYKTRIKAGAFLMASSFICVSCFSYMNEINPVDNDGLNFNVLMQLLGVALGSAQGSLGEASLLALGGKVDSMLEEGVGARRSNENNESVYIATEGVEEMEDDIVVDDVKSVSIAAFSSGTGLAGVLGFAYVYIFTHYFHLSLSATLIVALMIFPFTYWIIFVVLLAPYTVEMEISSEITALSSENSMSNTETQSSPSRRDDFQDHPPEIDDTVSIRSSSSFSLNVSANEMEPLEKFWFVLTLWPYMVPLFVVYAAEYALQSGVWTSIGFPVDDAEERAVFYQFSNWMYQAGVFISRSSGAFFTAPMWVLWLMPVLQIVNLILFYLIAAHHFLYNYALLAGCFYVGLLGGAVYVHGYSRINKDLPVSKREFALASASVADSFGIFVADISGLFIQACLYRSNRINGAVAVCPL